MKYVTRQRVFRSVAVVCILAAIKLIFVDQVNCPSIVESTNSDHGNIRGVPIESSHNMNPLIQNPTLESIAKMTTLFESTIRSCLGVNCFDMKAGDTDRVGLLALPMTGAENIVNAITSLGIPLSTNKYSFVSSTNVPAYGYGKNHGWSRIIRLVRRPAPHALHILLPTGKLSSTIGALLYEAQVRAPHGAI